ncbi:hypothetical protein OBBRIDRAFT_555649 [Obba rivulosa]|uniref:Uncharacterized protein n=1 Tax=Obba rivulosa TaxID=1052685 RepID=A0A8E2B3Y8_9APHY|nr:hypothetical protein OBBRIDRAFT_555649 [Obba rivulosa]
MIEDARGRPAARLAGHGADGGRLVFVRACSEGCLVPRGGAAGGAASPLCCGVRGRMCSRTKRKERTAPVSRRHAGGRCPNLPEPPREHAGGSPLSPAEDTRTGAGPGRHPLPDSNSACAHISRGPSRIGSREANVAVQHSDEPGSRVGQGMHPHCCPQSKQASRRDAAAR